MQDFHIAVIPGDGIGIEIMGSCLKVLDALEQKHGGFSLIKSNIDAGAIQGLLDRLGHIEFHTPIVRAVAPDP